MKRKSSIKSKIVLDTNVIISALITDGLCRSLLKQWSNGTFILCTSDKILTEIEEVSKRTTFRRYFSLIDLQKLLWHIKQKATFVKGTDKIPKKYLPDDVKDTIFVSCILASKADYFITGNVKHFKKHIPKTKVISPSEFLKSTTP